MVDSSNPGSQLRVTKLSACLQTEAVSLPLCVGAYPRAPACLSLHALTLATRVPLKQEPHLLRLSFHESGGGQFYETVAEMKDRMGAAGTGGRGTPVEALRKSFWCRSPPPEPRANAFGRPAALYQPTEGSSSTVAPAPGSASSPSQDDQEAAAVARSAEAEEEQATRAGAQSISPPPVGTEAERARDGPPEYVP